MVKPIQLALLFGTLFCCLFSSAQAASLNLSLNKNEVEMGKFIIATFTYQGNFDPGEINLNLWQKDFYLQQGDADLTRLEFNQIESTSTVRLYPRHSGKITLDAIALGGSFVKPISIRVLPSIRNNIDATPKIQTIKPHYWADEAIFISVDVPLHYPRNEVIAKEWELAGFNVSALKSQIINLKDSKLVRLNWMVYTPHKGRYQVELPAIVQRGTGRFRYHLPTINLNIKPLPAYLPSSIASGELIISSQVIKQSDQQNTLQIKIQKQGYLPETIEGFQSFINQLSDNEIALNLRQSEITQQGLKTRIYTITLPDYLYGQQYFLDLSYFNTTTGLLETTHFVLARMWTIPKPILWLVVYLLIFLSIIILIKLQPFAQQWRQKQKYKQRIQYAKNNHQLRFVLLNKRYKSLLEWSENQTNKESKEITKSLNAACYQNPKSANYAEFEQLKMACQKLSI